MSAEGVLKWFACLFGNVPGSARTGGSASKTTNRTVIVLTAKPKALLTLMNASEENNIADAAERASKLLNDRCETIYLSMPMPKRFAYMCVLGPITDYELAKQITHEWIKSRGGQPRTVYAEILAQRYGIAFNVDVMKILDLDDDTVEVVIIESSAGSSTLEIRPKKPS